MKIQKLTPPQNVNFLNTAFAPAYLSCIIIWFFMTTNQMFCSLLVVEDDLSQSLKNGYLLLEDEIDHVRVNSILRSSW